MVELGLAQISQNSERLWRMFDYKKLVFFFPDLVPQSFDKYLLDWLPSLWAQATENPCGNFPVIRNEQHLCNRCCIEPRHASRRNGWSWISKTLHQTTTCLSTKNGWSRISKTFHRAMKCLLPKNCRNNNVQHAESFIVSFECTYVECIRWRNLVANFAENFSPVNNNYWTRTKWPHNSNKSKNGYGLW